MLNNASMLRLLAVPAFVLSMGASPFAYGAGAGQYMDDATITAKVKAALMADSQLKATQVSVETNQGTVQLTGMVDTKNQEAEAIKIANKVDGVKSVTDMIKIKGMQEQPQQQY
jgi:osmotically-inducible protein OsmY